MNSVWFKPLGWIYRPVSWQGWALLLFALAFCAQVFHAIDRHSHSAGDTPTAFSRTSFAPPVRSTGSRRKPRARKRLESNKSPFRLARQG